MPPVPAVSRTTSAVVAAGTLLWLALLIVSPYLVSRTPEGHALFDAGGLVYLAGHAVCHQRSDRSFHAWGVQLPVCGRCFGLYAGAALGALLVAFQRRSRHSPFDSRVRPFAQGRPPATRHSANWLLRFALAAAPTVASVALEMAGLWAQSPLIRCVAALPLGITAGWFVAAFAPDVAQRLRPRTRRGTHVRVADAEPR